MQSICSSEKVKQLIELLQDKEVQSFLKLFIDNSIVTSELNILKRLSTIENALGLNCDPEEEHAPTIPEQITVLSEKIESLSESTGAHIKEPEVIPEGVAENRAYTIFNEAKKAIEAGSRYFGTKRINYILRNSVPEEYRVKPGQNVGQAKKEAFAKLDKMFPGMFSFNPNQHGRKDIRLVFKS